MVCIRQRVTNLPASPLGNSFLYFIPPTGTVLLSHCHELKFLKIKSHFGLWPRPPPTPEAHDSLLGRNPLGVDVSRWQCRLEQPVATSGL